MPEDEKLLNDHKKSNTEKSQAEVEQETVDLAPYIYPLSAFLIPLLVYMRTMCKALYIGDGGDFITAAYTLGVPHPPGYPLYTLLGKFFLSLPIPGGISEAAWRMNFMSVFFGALTTLLVYFLILRITKYNWLAFFAALAVAFARTYWSQAVITEVYTLNTFFIVLQLYLLVIRTEKWSKNTLIWLGLALGLSLAHHPSIAIFFPAYIYYSYVHRDHNMTRILLVALAFGLAIINPIGLLAILLLIPHELMIKKKSAAHGTGNQKSAMAIGIVLFILSIALYAYLPIVGYKNPVTGPMQFESAAENFDYFMETVTRQVYNYKAMTPGERLTTTPMVFSRYLEILWEDFVVLSFIFFLGFIALKKRNKMAWTVFLCYMLFMITVLLYPSGDILRAPLKNLEVVMPPLMIPAQLMFVLFGFIGIGYIVNWIPVYAESMKEIDTTTTVEKKIQYLNIVVIGSLIVLVLVIIPFGNWRFCDKSQDLVAYNYGRNVIDNAPENSFVLNTGDETFLFWYLQIVEKYKPEKNVELQNWIHNIRNFEVLADENAAIREVLYVLLNREAVSERTPEIKTDLSHFFGYDHYCATFLTEEVQKDIIFCTYDAEMHGLVYEFVKKPVEYYDKYHYSIHPDYGIVPNSYVMHDNMLSIIAQALMKTGLTQDGVLKLFDVLRVARPDYDTFEKKKYEESYYLDDYPGMRLRMDYKIPYGEMNWDGLFLTQDVSHEFPDEDVILELNFDPTYKDPQEQEIIGRYQEMFHNIGAWNIAEVRGLEDEEKIAEHYFWAIRSFRHEIMLDPADKPGWLALGNAYLQRNNFENAVFALSEYRNRVITDPDSSMAKKSEAHYYLALALLFQGSFNQALQEVDRALIFSPDSEKTKNLRQAIIDQESLYKQKLQNFEDFTQGNMNEDSGGSESAAPSGIEENETPAVPADAPE